MFIFQGVVVLLLHVFLIVGLKRAYLSENSEQQKFGLFLSADFKDSDFPPMKTK